MTKRNVVTLLAAHNQEMGRKNAKYIKGESDDFPEWVVSKTDKGYLMTSFVNKHTAKINHEWDD